MLHVLCTHNKSTSCRYIRCWDRLETVIDWRIDDVHINITCGDSLDIKNLLIIEFRLCAYLIILNFYPLISVIYLFTCLPSQMAFVFRKGILIWRRVLGNITDLITFYISCFWYYHTHSHSRTTISVFNILVGNSMISHPTVPTLRLATISSSCLESVAWWTTTRNSR